MTTSNSTPVTLWIFSLELLNDTKDKQTCNVNALSFVSKMTTKLAPALVAGDVVNIPGKGWRRVLELLTYNDPDVAQRVLCTTQVDPTIGPAGVTAEETLPGEALHCITRVPPAQVAHDDVLVRGNSGARFYARVDEIQYHNGSWVTKARPSK